MALMKTRRGALAGTVAGNALYPLLSQGALTLSAGVITDATRLAGVEGDGAAYPDSSAGVWPAATNQILNGGFETNATGWGQAGGGETIVRTTAESKFGAASLSVTTPAVAFRGTAQINGYWQPVTPGTTYTASGWVKYPVGTNGRMNLTDREAGGASAGVTSVDFVATGEWQRITNTRTAAATAATQQIAFMVTDAVATTFYVDGVQHEAGSIATPYIETDGGTASRVVGRIQMPASVLDETQMWVAARFVVPAAYDSDYTTDPAIFSWGDDSANNIRMVRANSSNAWTFRRIATTNTAALDGTVHAAGDEITLVGYCTAAEVAISENGAAFTKQGGTQYIPTLAANTADIGTDTPIFGSSVRISGHRYYWFAAGKGTLTDADAALFHAWGNNDPQPHMLPSAADPTFLAYFNGDGTAYRYAA